MLTEANSAKIAIEGAMKTALARIAGQLIVAELKKKRDKTARNLWILNAEAESVGAYTDAVSGSVMMTEENQAGEKPVQDETS